ncbi:hypothetical protein ACFY19_02975 [Streptosporangium saharense]|uniref:hypothetical protein n=1 Tax=Streptosporangium saharense TaxID=1706840 RepID=UPI0036D0EF00
MSKTDKTRPWWARMAETPMVTCLPVHDHRFGPCTLPDRITADSASRSARTAGCYWGAPAGRWFGHTGRGGYLERYHLLREERRSNRRRARRELRAYLDTD